jgi:Polyketide cyclase / dehydrase and lipid transport
MATIHAEIVIRSAADAAWTVLSAVGDVRHVFAPVLSGSHMEAPGRRVVTFANGMVIKERIVDCDPVRRRIAYAVVESDFIHHSASMQIVPIDDRTCRFVWTTDVLPDAAVEGIRPLMEAGTLALKQNLERLKR